MWEACHRPVFIEHSAALCSRGWLSSVRVTRAALLCSALPSARSPRPVLRPPSGSCLQTLPRRRSRFDSQILWWPLGISLKPLPLCVPTQCARSGPGPLLTTYRTPTRPPPLSQPSCTPPSPTPPHRVLLSRRLKTPVGSSFPFPAALWAQLLQSGLRRSSRPLLRIRTVRKCYLL